MYSLDAEDSLTSTDSALEKEAKGLLTTGATKKKKKMKKRVSWKEESALQEIFYFEMDEDERGTVVGLDFWTPSSLCCNHS